MAKWVVVTTIVVIITGVAIMIAWTTVNELLAGRNSEIDWLRTIAGVVVIVFAAAYFAWFTGKISEPPQQREVPEPQR